MNIDLNTLIEINAPLWGTFNFPKLLNGKGIETPFIKSDAPDAEMLIQDWYINTSRVVGFKFYAFPEVLKRDRKTQTPLHYHALFIPEISRNGGNNIEKFKKVAMRKWDNLLRSRYPRARYPNQPLWIESIDRFDPDLRDAPERYCLKQQDIPWNWSHCLTEETVKLVRQERK